MSIYRRTNRAGASLAIAALVVVASGLAPASATSDVEPDHQFTSVREFWTANGVSTATQEALVDKLGSGELIDANKAVAEPVSVESTWTDGREVTVATFPDGSIVVTSAEQPRTPAPGQISTQAGAVYGNCKVTSGSGWINYKNCEVVGDSGTYRIGFNVTYEKYSGGYAQIKSSGNAQSASGFGSITAPTRSLWRPKSAATQQAVVKYHSEYTGYLSAHQTDVYLAFWLTKTGVASVGTS